MCRRTVFALASAALLAAACSTAQPQTSAVGGDAGGAGDGAVVDDATGGAADSPATTAHPITQTEEYIRSNEPCPEGLVPLGVSETLVGITAELFIDIEAPTTIAFVGETWGYVGQRDGHVWRFGYESPEELTLVLNLAGDTAAEHDQGLLSMVIAPGGQWLLINRTNGAGDTVLTAHFIREDTLLGPPIELLTLDQRTHQHNGGDLVFDAEGYLYFSPGDGGGLGDPKHFAQDRSTPFGSILRLAIDPTAPVGERAVAPPDNPFVGQEGIDDRIWAWGVRNPFGIAYDAVNDLVWVADTGQQCLEEINALSTSEGGANLGWNRYEGTRLFVGDPNIDHRVPDFEYRNGFSSHDSRVCSIVGGQAYYGQEHPALGGRFVFADFCGGRVYALSPDDLSPDGPGDTSRTSHAAVVDLGVQLTSIASIDVDRAGELYALDLDGGVWKLVSS